jgi:ketosteroid isomerase-like protein
MVQGDAAPDPIHEARAAAEHMSEESAMHDEVPNPSLVELAQRTLDAANAADFDALQRLYAPDAVWNAPGANIVEERFEGNVARRQFLESRYATLEASEVLAEEIRDLRNGVILAQLVQRGIPPGGTVSIEFRHATVSVWVNGLIVENSAYTDIDEARAAAEQLAQERE